MSVFPVLTADMQGQLELGNAALTALMGYLFVFLGIVLLMAVIVIMGKIMGAKKADPKKTEAQKAEPQKPAEAKDAPRAPGSAGELKLYDTDPKTAAMIMAIVADKMGKPINELRFKSIKEVK